MPKFQLVFSAVFLAAAAGIWLVLLRPVPARTATGVIRSKTFAPAGEYVRYESGNRYAQRTSIPMAEHFVLGIQVPGRSEELRYPVDPRAAATFEIGETVRVQYLERGLRPFWQRAYVTDVQRGN